MTNFEKLKSMTKEELADWLDEHGRFDESPWLNWFTKKYCENCESIFCKRVEAEEKLGISTFYDFGEELECAYCEFCGKCRFFEDKELAQDNKEMVKLWFEEEAE